MRLFPTDPPCSGVPTDNRRSAATPPGVQPHRPPDQGITYTRARADMAQW